MNYIKHYNLLIDRAKIRDIDCYTEQHHVVPKCMNGSNEPGNLVKLTPEEHYVAHQLLVKIYPDNSLLIFAAHMMGATRKGNKVYGWLRRIHAVSISKILSGKPKSQVHKDKISKTMAGRPSTKRGCTHSVETKLKISELATGRVCSEETRLKMSKSQKGKLRSVEDNIRRSNALKGKVTSEETKQKIRESQINRRNKL